MESLMDIGIASARTQQKSNSCSCYIAVTKPPGRTAQSTPLCIVFVCCCTNNYCYTDVKIRVPLLRGHCAVTLSAEMPQY